MPQELLDRAAVAALAAAVGLTIASDDLDELSHALNAQISAARRLLDHPEVSRTEPALRFLAADGWEETNALR